MLKLTFTFCDAKRTLVLTSQKSRAELLMEVGCVRERSPVHIGCVKGFLGDVRSSFYADVKIPSLDAVLKFDADVKKMMRVTNVKTASVKRWKGKCFHIG